MAYQQTVTDTATTFVVGAPTPEQTQFLKLGQKTLHKAIKAAKPGNQIRHISKIMQKSIEAAGYNVTRNLTGHGLGETMHQEPAIPCFISADPQLKTRIVPGMVLAIEIMYMKGSWRLQLADDGWTYETADGSDSAMFEEDVIITPDGPEIITAISQ